MRAAIIGTGNIGIDLAEKLLREHSLELIAMAGRRASSPGLARFEGRVKYLTADGVDGLEEHFDEIDVFFDATSADSHREHWKRLEGLGKAVVDLTPSRVGAAFVPGVLDHENQPGKPIHNMSMVTCGGQASVPMVSALARHVERVDYVEVSSSIASLSAGPATRANIDDYIRATENAARLASGADVAKSILVLNPVEPPTIMRTTVHMKGLLGDLATLDRTVRDAVDLVREYVPGYRLLVPPVQHAADVLTVSIGVEGAGDYLPPYAGNLDIITAAAVKTALDMVAVAS
ncbi:acetaldehyde dehydrogenase (acetylating) [Cellulomonas humilata]|uniref:Acetaldehyde dehydrogenase n=1 Tax=Cellulomonas humilata TaxID=144055 RepID=A0A7Y5ZZ64_9CELL|nr:acetaldehyde dehydrogenase (acetylating) [Cellulomonas humilata]NUU16782.1 acetaldehyde dehydrogenase (acetylating) [Cellulomonas humilata]